MLVHINVVPLFLKLKSSTKLTMLNQWLVVEKVTWNIQKKIVKNYVTEALKRGSVSKIVLTTSICYSISRLIKQELITRVVYTKRMRKNRL